MVWTTDQVQAGEEGDLVLTLAIDADFDLDQDWLANEVEISTSDLEYSYDNNRNTFTIKPESDRLYAAAVGLGGRSDHAVAEPGRL